MVEIRVPLTDKLSFELRQGTFAAGMSWVLVNHATHKVSDIDCNEVKLLLELQNSGYQVYPLE